MARSVFPDEGSRLVFRLSGANKPLLSAAGGIATVYADAAGTTLADIQTTDGDSISGARLTIDAQSRMPLFLGPDGEDTVWISVDGGVLAPVYARTDDRIDTLGATILNAVLSVNDNLPDVSGNVDIAAGAVTDATTGAKGVIQLAGDLAGTAALPTVPGAVKTTGAQVVAGVKTFTDKPTVPDASFTLAKVIATGTRDATTYLRGDGVFTLMPTTVGLRYSFFWNGTDYVPNADGTGTAATAANSTAAARAAAGVPGSYRDYIAQAGGPDPNALDLMIDGDSYDGTA